MKRLVAALSAAALLLASAPAFAEGNRHKHRGHGHAGHYSKSYDRHGGHHGYKRHAHKRHGHKRHGYGHRGHGYRGGKGYDYGPVIVGALVGGAVLGHLLSQPAYSAPNHYIPPPRPLLGNCRATTGTHTYNGRVARFGGTMCYDQYGRGHIAPGSRYFIGYLN